ncbi:MAG: hypothetical protein ACUVXA_15765 [Candidatus Jordarchaeum sp.]|uniref:hypothetical protein n=1 Tax=Candidatus Jordarchaeum sp. TaxID=2823881 RepID=UPI00404B3682
MSKSGSEGVKKNGEFVSMRGIGIPVRLYKLQQNKLDGDEVIKLMKKQLWGDGTEEGFIKPRKLNGEVQAEYVVSYPTHYYTLDSKGRIVPVSVMAQDKGEIHVRLKTGVIELRGSYLAAKRSVAKTVEITGVKAEAMTLSDDAMDKLMKKAKEVSTVTISNLENPYLNSLEIRGEAIKRAPEILIFRKRQRGRIQTLRGTYSLPSGQMLTCFFNSKGSFIMYRKGEGIYTDDLEYMIDYLESLTITTPQ